MSTLITGALLLDGTGAPARRGDALIVGGRIAELGEVTGTAERTLDAGGLVLAPGFIDMHAHSDLAVVTDPAHLAARVLRAQGVASAARRSGRSHPAWRGDRSSAAAIHAAASSSLPTLPPSALSPHTPRTQTKRRRVYPVFIFD